MITRLLSKLPQEQHQILKDTIGYNRFINQANDQLIANTNRIDLTQFNPAFAEAVSFILLSNKLATVKTTANSAILELNLGLFDKDALTQYRIESKQLNAFLTLDTQEYATTLVKRNGTMYDDGLERPNSNKAAKTEFSFDTNMIEKYYPYIKRNLLKAINKMAKKRQLNKTFFNDEASYIELANLAIKHYSKPNKYNLEYSAQDQRGRAIKGATSKIGNPIASKDFRALLKLANPTIVNITDIVKLEDIYYFLAELLGLKCLGQTEQAKIEAGKSAYQSKLLPHCDLRTEKGLKELHALIWVERIYAKLNALHRYGTVIWDIPLEIDFSMSMAQIGGSLLNDEETLTATNLKGNKLSDPWYANGVPRDAMKAVGTPTLYGSNASIRNLLRAKGMELEANQLALLKKQFKQGRFNRMARLKDILIHCSNIDTPVFTVNTGITKFDVEVSKFKYAGSSLKLTKVFNGKVFKHIFTHVPQYVPDYGRFKTYFQTLLFHHLDSDCMEWMLGEVTTNCIDIFDAVLALPGDARAFREAGATRMKFYNNNRKLILDNYMESIGATSNKAYKQLLELLADVPQADDIPFNRTCMK